MNPLPRPLPDPAVEPALPFPEEAPAPAPAPGTKPPGDATGYWEYCPNCSARLRNVGCKYRCPRCHYFMSCSDFD